MGNIKDLGSSKAKGKRLASDKSFRFITSHPNRDNQINFDELREGQAVTFDRGQGPRGPRFGAATNTVAGDSPVAQAQRPNLTLKVTLEELHSPQNGRIDAGRVAEFLGVPLSRIAAALRASAATVHKTPDALGLQSRLMPIKRALELIADGTGNRHTALAWLNSAHPDLGEKTPIQVLLDGQADAVITVVENALAGLPA